MDEVSIPYSTGGPQLVDGNPIKRLPYACRIPTLGEDRSQALLRQAKDREGIGLDRPVTPPLLPGITYMAAAGQVKPASIA